MALLLDQTVFAFDDPQARELLDVLLKVHDREASVRQFVAAVGLLPAAIEWRGPLTDIWPRVLEHAASARKLRELIQVVAQHPNSAEYDIFKVLLSQEPPAAERDPCAALLVGGGRTRAFIDRGELRATLREMLDAPGGRVLIVDGDRRCGKTWTWFLLCHVLGNRKITPYKIDLSAYVPPVEVSDIAAALTDQLGWDLGHGDPFASEATHVRRLVNVAKRHMRALSEDHWLVFDGMVGTALTPSALRMVEGLAEAVVDGETGDRLNMVLIAYDGQLQPSADPYVWRTHLGPIGVEHLHEFFCSIAVSAGARIDPAVADLLVKEVLREATGGDHDPGLPLPLERISHLAALRGRQLYQMYGGTGG
ncbi:effector-associated domain EAD1-containing protein [Streptomyces iakyrus]|uniref:effector-associated domain EAD1-containing protein n=1 Tax=Streptomyces iakyrus TaxID=68219 RepID=UPI00052403BF|nr:effector-associated domain EAD1-containing protein [Streptomyces iakyrus]